MRAAIENKHVDSPVTIAAILSNVEFFKAPGGNKRDVLAKRERQYDEIASTVADLKNMLNDAIPNFVRDQKESMLRRYSNEFELVKTIRDSGIIGVSRRRSAVLGFLKSAIDEEETEIMFVGSSLKGLLQNREYEDIRQKLISKSRTENLQVRFLLTHPVFADFRAKQEHRKHGWIGKEIIASLRVLEQWGLDSGNVRLYLGTPTAFAVRTSRKMLINPYPYRAQAFESPCILVRSEKEPDVECSCYFYDHFNEAHFGAWDTDLAIQIDSFDRVIATFEKMLNSYSVTVNAVMAQAMQIDDD